MRNRKERDTDLSTKGGRTSSVHEGETLRGRPLGEQAIKFNASERGKSEGCAAPKLSKSGLISTTFG